MTAPTELKVSNANMALGRWFAALVFAPFFAALSAWVLIGIGSEGLPRGGDEWMLVLLALVAPFFAWDFFIKGWHAVLWAKFSDRLRLRRWWGTQTLTWEEVDAIYPVLMESNVAAQGLPVAQNFYFGVQIEVRHGGAHHVVLSNKEYATLQMLLAAQGREGLIQDLPE